MQLNSLSCRMAGDNTTCAIYSISLVDDNGCLIDSNGYYVPARYNHDTDNSCEYYEILTLDGWRAFRAGFKLSIHDIHYDIKSAMDFYNEWSQVNDIGTL